MKPTDEITLKVGECQHCGLVGGVVLSWSEDGIARSTWCCPRCVHRADEALRNIAEARGWLASFERDVAAKYGQQ
jgi:hypothetical protein